MFTPSYLFSETYPGLTSFFSLEYLVFFLPACLLLFFITPSNKKKYSLLFLSCLFYALLSGKLIVYLLITILLAFIFGNILDNLRSKMSSAVKQAEKADRKRIKKQFQIKLKLVLSVSIIAHIGMLVILKYSDFFLTNINSVLEWIGSDFQFLIPKFIVPVGLSFFSLQTVSYLTDVYRGIILAEKNICKLSLFIGFFPQIVEGPICRYSQTANQLWGVKQVHPDNLSLGVQRFLFGMFKKTVIADRLNPLVNAVFDDPTEHGGIMVVVAAIAYTIQLYMDFSGAMDAVIGIAQIFGVSMPENFKRPFFSKSISEFWTRWHITLGTWFKDYLFYPMSMSKNLKTLTTHSRKKIGNYYGPLVSGSIALFCVWLCNGLWHGSAWNYIFFGLYHFVLILFGNIFTPLSKKLLAKCHINSEGIVYSSFRIIRTSILVVIGELFFRANDLTKGFQMFFCIFNSFKLPELEDGFLGNFRLSFMDLVVLAIALIIVFITSVLNEIRTVAPEKLPQKRVTFRWAIILLTIISIIIFGAYGEGYVPVDPIYANF